jgi:diamine N-acetyltransferase
VIRLLPLSRTNWEACAQLEPLPEQQGNLPSNLFSIAESAFEPSLEGFAIYDEQTLVGFAMTGTFSQVPWVTRLMIGWEHQGRGLGREALHLLCEKLLTRPGVQELRASVAVKNPGAEYLFYQEGFRRIGEPDSREIVLRLIRQAATGERLAP